MSHTDAGQSITLTDRLEHGFLSIDEVCALKACGRTLVYKDIRAGVLPIVKHGRSTRIAGPVAKNYNPGAYRLTAKAAR